MLSVALAILTVVLILVSLFLILVVLAQKSQDGGMGTALGGGAAEAAFGAETNTVLSKATIYSSVLFFVLALLLYLGRIYERAHARDAATSALPTIAAPATPVSTAPTKPLTVPGTPATAPATTAPLAAPTTGTATASASGTATPTTATKQP